MIRSMIFSRPGLKSTTENMLHVWKKQLTTCYQHSCKGETSWEIQHYEMIFYSVNYNFGTFCSPWRWKKQFFGNQYQNMNQNIFIRISKYILLLPTDSILAALTYLIHCIENVVFLIITAAIVHHTMKIQRQYQRKPNQSSPFQWLEKNNIVR